MYYDKFLPFYLTYASPVLYSGERMQEREFALMKSYFPDTALKVQEKVEEECELLDYLEHVSISSNKLSYFWFLCTILSFEFWWILQ